MSMAHPALGILVGADGLEPSRRAELKKGRKALFNILLIIIGKHGKGRVEELLLGGTTKHVLAESRGDVLVAR